MVPEEAIKQIRENDCSEFCTICEGEGLKNCRWAVAIDALEKQIPQKPNWTTDYTWGDRKKQPVCPVCDYYLSKFEFIGNGKKITYCEHCGQAIDWEVTE